MNVNFHLFCQQFDDDICRTAIVALRRTAQTQRSLIGSQCGARTVVDPDAIGRTDPEIAGGYKAQVNSAG